MILVQEQMKHITLLELYLILLFISIDLCKCDFSKFADFQFVTKIGFLDSNLSKLLKSYFELLTYSDVQFYLGRNTVKRP